MKVYEASRKQHDIRLDENPLCLVGVVPTLRGADIPGSFGRQPTLGNRLMIVTSQEDVCH
jgi:hypothetical protein